MKQKILKLENEIDNLHNLMQAEEKNLERVKEHLNNIIEAQETAQEAAQAVQQKVHEQIADVVNKCLCAVFDEPYQFLIRFSPKRGKTEAELLFLRDGKEIKDVGGGVIDVCSFALRLSSILLSQKNLSPVMILDEPFKNVSKAKGYLERIPEMLITLSEEFGVQFIQVTHIEELKIGKVIDLK